MPEGIEIEYYRRAATAALGRRISRVTAGDDWYLKRATTAPALRAALAGSSFLAARRRGKLMLLETEGSTTIGLRFGMTGRLIVDDTAIIEQLEYSSGRNDPAWDRFRVDFADGGFMSMRDPRRLGGVELGPDVDALGVDLYEVTAADLTAILGGSTRSLKAVMLDQSCIAGLGNLLTDEILWRASLHPARIAASLDATERRRLLHHTRRVVEQLTERGGSHMGDLQAHRHPGAVCPRDGAPLEHRTLAGRTTYACTVHQGSGKP